MIAIEVTIELKKPSNPRLVSKYLEALDQAITRLVTLAVDHYLKTVGLDVYKTISPNTEMARKIVAEWEAAARRQIQHQFQHQQQQQQESQQQQQQQQQGWPDFPSLSQVFRSESLFEIEEIIEGSIRLKGLLTVAAVAAILTACLQATVLESLVEGYKQTQTHQVISSIPKYVESFIIEFIRALLMKGPLLLDHLTDTYLIAIVPRGDDFVLQIIMNRRKGAQSK